MMEVSQSLLNQEMMDGCKGMKFRIYKEGYYRFFLVTESRFKQAEEEEKNGEAHLEKEFEAESEKQAWSIFKSYREKEEPLAKKKLMDFLSRMENTEGT